MSRRKVPRIIEYPLLVATCWIAMAISFIPLITLASLVPKELAQTPLEGWRLIVSLPVLIGITAAWLYGVHLALGIWYNVVGRHARRRTFRTLFNGAEGERAFRRDAKWAEEVARCLTRRCS